MGKGGSIVNLMSLSGSPHWLGVHPIQACGRYLRPLCCLTYNVGALCLGLPWQHRGELNSYELDCYFGQVMWDRSEGMNHCHYALLLLNLQMQAATSDRDGVSAAFLGGWSKPRPWHKLLITLFTSFQTCCAHNAGTIFEANFSGLQKISMSNSQSGNRGVQPQPQRGPHPSQGC